MIQSISKSIGPTLFMSFVAFCCDVEESVLMTASLILSSLLASRAVVLEGGWSRVNSEASKSSCSALVRALVLGGI